MSSGSAPPPYERVTLAVDEATVEDCRVLTEVAVDPPLPLLTQSYPELAVMAREDLKNELRRATAQEGGDTVLMTGIENGTMHGKTYACRAKGRASAASNDLFGMAVCRRPDFQRSVWTDDVRPEPASKMDQLKLH